MAVPCYLVYAAVSAAKLNEPLGTIKTRLQTLPNQDLTALISHGTW